MSYEPDPEWEAMRHKMVEAIDPVLRGTTWGPSDDEGAVLTDAVVITGWVAATGEYFTSVVKTGSPWGAEGLIHDAYQREVESDRGRKRRQEEEDE